MDLELLRFLSSTHRSLHDQRRKVEFQVLFTTLTFYIAVSGAVLTGQVTLPSSACFKFLVGLAFFVVAWISSIYLWLIHSANQTNITIAEKAEDAIASVLGKMGFPGLVPDEFQNKRQSQSFCRRIFRSWFWQASITNVFALAAAVIICKMTP